MCAMLEQMQVAQIRLEKAAQPLAGGWKPEIGWWIGEGKGGAIQARSVQYWVLSGVLSWQEKGTQGPAQQQFQGKEGRHGKENNILLHYKAICFVTWFRLL